MLPQRRNEHGQELNEKFSMTLTIGENVNQMTIRYSFTSVNIDSFKRHKNNTYWPEVDVIHWGWECKLVQTLWKSVWRL